MQIILLLDYLPHLGVVLRAVPESFFVEWNRLGIEFGTTLFVTILVGLHRFFVESSEFLVWPEAIIELFSVVLIGESVQIAST